jgi:hypothetical protein
MSARRHHRRASSNKSVLGRRSDVDRRVLHLIKMWLDCPVEETDDRGRKTRTTEARDDLDGVHSPTSRAEALDLDMLDRLGFRRWARSLGGLALVGNSGRRLRFTGTTVLRVENGMIAEEVGLDDGVTALQQLGILKAA